nr:amyloid-beta A4 precursor protein-binding family B member 3-like [Oncorhynchus nerka]
MLGKDYMLAIIIVNYDDNIWNDPSLDLDSDLPSGWRTIRDSTGTYYWHVATGATQWQHPSYSTEEDQNSINGITAMDIKSLEAGGRRESRARLTESPLASINDRVSWQDDYFCTNIDPDSKCLCIAHSPPTQCLCITHSPPTQCLCITHSPPTQCLCIALIAALPHASRSCLEKSQ